MNVKEVHQVKKKLVEFGATIIDGKYVLKSELEQIAEAKIKALKKNKSATNDWITGSSFEEFKS